MRVEWRLLTNRAASREGVCILNNKPGTKQFPPDSMKWCDGWRCSVVSSPARGGGEPGAKILWQGLQRVVDFAAGLRYAREAHAD